MVQICREHMALAHRPSSGQPGHLKHINLPPCRRVSGNRTVSVKKRFSFFRTSDMWRVKLPKAMGLLLCPWAINVKLTSAA